LSQLRSNTEAAKGSSLESGKDGWLETGSDKGILPNNNAGGIEQTTTVEVSYDEISPGERTNLQVWHRPDSRGEGATNTRNMV